MRLGCVDLSRTSPLLLCQGRRARCGFLGEAIGVGRVAGKRDFGGAVGHGGIGEGGRGAEHALFGVEVVGIDGDRVVSLQARSARRDSRVGRGLLGAVVEAIGD